MFALRPVPSHAGASPRDGRPLAVRRLVLTGTRLLVEGTDPATGHVLVQDLPSGHGLIYPTTVDVDDGTAWGRWFGHLLQDGLAAPDEDPVALEVVAHGEPRTDVVLLSCLDFVYGHALLRLLNAQRHLDAGEALVVLVPRGLAHLVPDGVAETWILDEPLGRLRGRLTQLDARLQSELDRFATVTLSPAFPHPHPSTWELGRFTGPLEPDRSGEPSIVLVDRADRLWGGERRMQARNLAALWELLRAARPGAGATVVGVAEPGDAPDGVRDLRQTAPDVETERGWLRAAAGANVVIGVHGSSLLLPSALGAATVELLPADRYANAGQGTLLGEPDPVAAQMRVRTIPGSDALDDITPERVAAVALAILDADIELLAGPPAGVGDGPVVARDLAAPAAGPPAAPPPHGGLRARLSRAGRR